MPCTDVGLQGRVQCSHRCRSCRERPSAGDAATPGLQQEHCPSECGISSHVPTGRRMDISWNMLLNLRQKNGVYNLIILVCCGGLILPFSKSCWQRGWQRFRTQLFLFSCSICKKQVPWTLTNSVLEGNRDPDGGWMVCWLNLCQLDTGWSSLKRGNLN